MKVVFTDTNIYVSLLTRSDLVDPLINGLVDKIKSDKIIHLFPLTTQSEAIRNINEVSNKKLRSLEFSPLQFPRTENELRVKVKKVNKEIKEHLEKNRKELIQTKKSLLNKITKELIPNSLSPKETISLMNLAYLRKGKGFPPGKPEGNIGDQLAWEIILKNFRNEEVIIISQDPDWHNHNSSEKKPKLHYLLEEEWKSKSKHKIKLYYSIGYFLYKEFGESIKPKTAQAEPDKKAKSNLSDLIDLALSDIPSGYVVNNSSPMAVSGSNSLFGVNIASGSILASGVSGPSISNIGTVSSFSCKHCGYPISLGDKFCSQCGRGIN